MKTTFIKSLLMLCMALLTACTQNDLVITAPVAPPHAIPLTDGLSYIRMYHHYCKQRNLDEQTVFRAASIARPDLLGIMGIDTTSCGKSVTFGFYRARAYVGYDTVAAQFHLIFTPVIEDSTEAGRDSILTDAKGNPFVYDLTTPCPNTCDYSSPLYKAFGDN